MANPQLEEGYIRIANELWEALSRIRIPGEARQVLFAIIRLTWGWGKKLDTISMKQLNEATGIPKPRIIRARKKLIEMKMITVAQKGNRTAPSYSFNKHYDRWNPLPKKATLPKKAIGVAQKGNKPLPKKTPSIDSKTIPSKAINLVEREQLFSTQFWETYPKRKGKRVGKAKSLKLFLKIPEEKIGRTMTGVRTLNQYCTATGSYPKDPERWLRDELWEDWQSYKPDTQSNNQDKQLETALRSVREMFDVLINPEHEKYNYWLEEFNKIKTGEDYKTWDERFMIWREENQ